MSLCFGEFELDEERRQLLRSGQSVLLEPKAYELLSLLLRRRPKVLSKAQIRDVLWPSTAVSDTVLAGAVADVRAALGDDARQPRFIRTVHGFGYAFCGEVRDNRDEHPRAASGVQPRLVWGDRILSLAAGDNLLGRDKRAAVCLDVAGVSRQHARILVEDSGATLEDLASKNGTLLNGEPVSGARDLRDGDAIRLGPVQLLYRCLPFDGSTATQGD